MTHYLRIVDKDTGRATMKETPFPGRPVEPLDLAAPTGPSVATGATTKGVTCDVCGKTFAKAGIMAHHFNRTHTELKRNKNSWRKHVRQDESNSQ